MIFSGTNGDSLIEDITFKTKADLNMYPLADRTRYINEAYSRVAYIIMKADGRMSWDDPNHSNQPIAMTNLVANQSEYNIFSSAPSALQDWLAVERVDIMDSGGIGVQLVPLDQNDFKGVAQSEMDKTASVPYAFDFNGTIVRLYPAPNYSYTNGMTMWFNRAPSYFAITDTTKKPGFDTRCHQYLSVYASNEYLSTKLKDYSLQGKLQVLEDEIGKIYAVERDKVERPVISRTFKSFK